MVGVDEGAVREERAIAVSAHEVQRALDDERRGVQLDGDA
jgi:hypothetical protein